MATVWPAKSTPCPSLPDRKAVTETIAASSASTAANRAQPDQPVRDSSSSAAGRAGARRRHTSWATPLTISRKDNAAPSQKNGAEVDQAGSLGVRFEHLQ